MRVKLATKQVIRLFGMRPHLGRRIPVTHIKSTCGVEWHQPRIPLKSGAWMPVGEGYFRAHKVTVNAVICLIPVQGKPNVWDVKVDPSYEPQAMMWLSQNFDEVLVVG